MCEYSKAVGLGHLRQSRSEWLPPEVGCGEQESVGVGAQSKVSQANASDFDRLKYDMEFRFRGCRVFEICVFAC